MAVKSARSVKQPARRSPGTAKLRPPTPKKPAQQPKKAPAPRPPVRPAKAAASRKPARSRVPAPKPVTLAGVVSAALQDMKAVDPVILDVRGLTDIADTMFVASGNSDRHVRSIADRVIENAKKAGFRPVGVEGERDGEWVLVDLQDIIVHVMLPRVREFYRLEDLWKASAAARET